MARALLQHTGLRVITNNLNVAIILSANPQCEVIVVGGVVRGPRPGHRGRGRRGLSFASSRSTLPSLAFPALRTTARLRDFDYREVKVSQTIISHAREVWLAADVSKFNRPAMVAVGHLSQIDRLFTDAPPPEPFPALLDEAQVRCDVAIA